MRALVEEHVDAVACSDVFLHSQMPGTGNRFKSENGVARQTNNSSPHKRSPLQLRSSMTDKTKPVSIRLTRSEIEQLQARAYTLSASVTGIARDLIRMGLARGR
jgi:hypothetical protein